MPSPKRRAKIHIPDSTPTLAKRREWADGHADLMDRARAAGLLRPGDPHWVCNHLRMDDPAWQPQAVRSA